MLTVGSLFAGIGGMDLGLERAGMVVKWQVEIDDYATRVLAKHWPDVKRYQDVREVGRHNLESVDLICGGFPCQDISNAGKRAGIDGERSGLWGEFARIIRELRPRYVLVENVAALLGRGIGRVLGDLAESRYDAEWEVLSACAFGASHTRERLFIIAHSSEGRCFCNKAVLANLEESQFEKRRFREPSSEPFPSHFGYRPNSEHWRVDNEFPDWMDRIAGLGNAVVPQVAEWIGRRIMEVHANGNDH